MVITIMSEVREVVDHGAVINADSRGRTITMPSGASHNLCISGCGLGYLYYEPVKSDSLLIKIVNQAISKGEIPPLIASAMVAIRIRAHVQYKHTQSRNYERRKLRRCPQDASMQREKAHVRTNASNYHHVHADTKVAAQPATHRHEGSFHAAYIPSHTYPKGSAAIQQISLPTSTISAMNRKTSMSR